MRGPASGHTSDLSSWRAHDTCRGGVGEDRSDEKLKSDKTSCRKSEKTHQLEGGRGAPNLEDVILKTCGLPAAWDQKCATTAFHPSTFLGHYHDVERNAPFMLPTSVPKDSSSTPSMPVPRNPKNPYTVMATLPNPPDVPYFPPQPQSNEPYSSGSRIRTQMASADFPSLSQRFPLRSNERIA